MKDFMRRAISLIMSIMIVLRVLPFEHAFAYGMSIDDNTVIYADQVESVAGHVGDYGWDSRGAVFKYHDNAGRIGGDLGTILFCDESGVTRDRMWDQWGNRFPDWWGRMLAEKVRSRVSTDKIPLVRQAFADSVTFLCYWKIAIGIKNRGIENGPYLTLRTDGSLRKAYHCDTSSLYPAERLFTGDEMSSSLSYLLPKSSWGQTSQQVFKERNPYIYTVTINSYMLNIYATDCVKCAKKGKQAGEYCSHNKHELMLVSIPIEYGREKYYDENSFVWQGQSVSYSEPEIDGYERNPAGDDLSRFVGTINGHLLTAQADSRLYLAYTGSTEEHEYEPEEDEVQDDGPAASPIPTSPPFPEDKEKHRDNDVSLASFDTSAQAVICSDIFDVQIAIPSTESVYIKGNAKDSLYSIDASLVSGSWPLPVTVGFPYRLTWEDEDGNEMEETGVTSVSTVIYRDYLYLHLNSLAFYLLDDLTVVNPALSPSQVSVSAKQTGARLPTVTEPVVYGTGTPEVGKNLELPSGYRSYIYAGRTIEISGGNERPDIPYISEYEAYSIADARTGNMRCRNDEFRVNGRNVLGDAGWRNGRSGSVRISMRMPEIVELNTSYVYGPDYITIPAKKRNEKYYTSSAKIRYEQRIVYGSARIAYNENLQVNPVNVHTPVICKAGIGEFEKEDPNSAYFQERPQNGSGGFIIVQGRSDSLGAGGRENKTQDFVITFSNRGDHPQYRGALTNDHDYSENVNGLNGGTYVKGNYIRFPFDVYMDEGNDSIMDNDIRISKKSWTLCESGQRFYLAETVEEGYYDLEALSATVNSVESDLNAIIKPPGANALQKDHTATDSLRVYVSGKLYGLTLYDVDSKSEWENVFVCNGVNKYLNTLVPGTSFKNWPRNDGTLVISSPAGKFSEEEVEKMLFYYTSGNQNEIGEKTGRERFGFPLAAGSNPIKYRYNKGMLKAGYEWKFRIRTTGSKMSAPGSSITVKPTYWAVDENGSRTQVYLYYETDRDHIARFDGQLHSTAPSAVRNGMQFWDFSFRLPGRIHMIARNRKDEFDRFIGSNGMIDLTEDFWMKNSSFTVNFEVTANDEHGNEFLYYRPVNGRCNMWLTEGQDIEKADHFGRRYRFDYGDIALIDIDKNAIKDYTIDHQN